MNLTPLNLVCWGAFAVVWFLGAVYNALKAPHTLTRRARYDSLILVLVIWGGMHAIPPTYWIVTQFHLLALQIAGSFLLGVSTLYTLWSRGILGKMWANNAAIKEDHQFVTKGPYGITRHPIYTGLLGMILGSTLSLGQGLGFLAFLLTLFFILNRIRHEECLLVMTFGERYLEYKKHVPKLIPGWKGEKH